MDPARRGLLNPTQIVKDVQREIDEVLASVLADRREQGLNIPAELEAELRQKLAQRTYKKISQSVLDAYVSGRYTQIEAPAEERKQEESELFHAREKTLRPPAKLSPENPDWPVNPESLPKALGIQKKA
jgi:hypothetical protein